MAQSVREPVSAQPLHGSEGASTITIDVAAKLLMVTPEWVRRRTKDGWIPKTDRGRYRVVDVVQGYIRFLKDEASRDQDGVPQPAARNSGTQGGPCGRANRARTRPAGESHDTRKLGGELR